MSALDSDNYMRRAIALAGRGEGAVEPNPMVGCVIVRDGQIVGEGWHQQFGGPHAEAVALRSAGAAARGATMFVTLEPCCHHGKTPPCAQAVVDSGVSRVVIAQRDPFPKVDGGGIRILREAGVDVELGVCEQQAQVLNAPYRKRLDSGIPWVIAKWAMTLDGKIATRTGDSQWISNESSRAVVHGIRGRVDAIMIGSGTARADDPLLTARPAGPRVATRIVLDSTACLSLDSQLVKTVQSAPVIVAASRDAGDEPVRRLRESGCEVLVGENATPTERLHELLTELGRRGMTNVLVEGGATLLGTLHDAQLIDEVHVFIAPKVVGGASAPGPVGGIGFELVAETRPLAGWTITELDGDIYVRGRVR